MGFFEMFPFTNFHDLNLDWLLAQMKSLGNAFEAFVTSNVLKYADPIDWSITSQYEANTIVRDGENVYLSKQAVPAGIAITNENYWFKVGDLSTYQLQLDQIRHQITDKDEGNNYVASTAYATGTLFFLNGFLSEAITDIETGETFVLNGNYKRVSFDEVFTDTVSGIDSQLDILSAGLAANINRRIKDHFRVFVDAVDGNDENSGTEAEPFKTLERALKYSETVTELRVTLLSAGNYYINGDQAASVSLHIKAAAPNVFLYIDTDGSNEFSVYAAHWNIEGYDENNHITVTAAPEVLSAAAAYFDCCLVTFGWADVLFPIRFYGCSCSLNASSFKQLSFHMSNYVIANGTTITNTDPNQHAIWNNSSMGRIQGGLSVANLSSEGTSNAVIYARNSYLSLLQTTPSNGVTNKYAYSLRTESGSIINITRTRLVNGNANAAQNSNISADTVLITEAGLVFNGCVRWSGSHLQRWDSTAWAWGNVPNL